MICRLNISFLSLFASFLIVNNLVLQQTQAVFRVGTFVENEKSFSKGEFLAKKQGEEGQVQTGSHVDGEIIESKKTDIPPHLLSLSENLGHSGMNFLPSKKNEFNNIMEKLFTHSEDGENETILAKTQVFRLDPEADGESWVSNQQQILPKTGFALLNLFAEDVLHTIFPDEDSRPQPLTKTVTNSVPGETEVVTVPYEGDDWKMTVRIEIQMEKELKPYKENQQGWHIDGNQRALISWVGMKTAFIVEDDDYTTKNWAPKKDKFVTPYDLYTTVNSKTASDTSCNNPDCDKPSSFLKDLHGEYCSVDCKNARLRHWGGLLHSGNTNSNYSSRYSTKRIIHSPPYQEMYSDGTYLGKNGGHSTILLTEEEGSNNTITKFQQMQRLRPEIFNNPNLRVHLTFDIMPKGVDAFVSGFAFPKQLRCANAANTTYGCPNKSWNGAEGSECMDCAYSNMKTEIISAKCMNANCVSKSWNGKEEEECMNCAMVTHQAAFLNGEEELCMVC